MIGDKIRAARKERGLSQQDLAMQSGLTLSVVSKIEQGVILDPRYSTLAHLAEVLGVPVAEIAGEEVPVPLDKTPRGTGFVESLRVLRKFASQMDRVWSARVARNEFSKEIFEEGTKVFLDFDTAYAQGFGDLHHALRTGAVTLPEAEREALDSAKASLDAWHRTMFDAEDALKIRGVPDVVPLAEERRRRQEQPSGATSVNTAIIMDEDQWRASI